MKRGYLLVGVAALAVVVAGCGTQGTPASWTEHTYRWDAEIGGSSVTIPVPEGWTVTEDGDKIDYRDPSGQMLLRLNLEQNLPGDPIDVFAA